jgi:hypothetical protein
MTDYVIAFLIKCEETIVEYTVFFFLKFEQEIIPGLTISLLSAQH